MGGNWNGSIPNGWSNRRPHLKGEPRPLDERGSLFDPDLTEVETPLD